MVYNSGSQTGGVDIFQGWQEPLWDLQLGKFDQ